MSGDHKPSTFLEGFRSASDSDAAPGMLSLGLKLEVLIKEKSRRLVIRAIGYQGVIYQALHCTLARLFLRKEARASVFTLLEELAEPTAA